MTRQGFFQDLAQALTGLPAAERGQVISYYGELIADAMEDGLSEEEAVARLGPLQDLVREVMETHRSVSLPVPGRPRKHGLGFWAAVILTAPLWGLLMLLLLGTLLLLCLSLLLVPLSFGFAALVAWAAGLYSILGSPFLMIGDGPALSLIQLGAGVAAVGVGVLCAIVAVYTGKWVLRFTKWSMRKFFGSRKQKGKSQAPQPMPLYEAPAFAAAGLGGAGLGSAGFGSAAPRPAGPRAAGHGWEDSRPAAPGATAPGATGSGAEVPGSAGPGAEALEATGSGATGPGTEGPGATALGTEALGATGPGAEALGPAGPRPGGHGGIAEKTPGEQITGEERKGS